MTKRILLTLLLSAFVTILYAQANSTPTTNAAAPAKPAAKKYIMYLEVDSLQYPAFMSQFKTMFTDIYNSNIAADRRKNDNSFVDGMISIYEQEKAAQDSVKKKPPGK